MLSDIIRKRRLDNNGVGGKFRTDVGFPEMRNGILHSKKKDNGKHGTSYNWDLQKFEKGGYLI